MSKSGVRVIHRAPRPENNTALLIVMLMIVPLFAPIQGAEAEARIESQAVSYTHLTLPTKRIV